MMDRRISVRIGTGIEEQFLSNVTALRGDIEHEQRVRHHKKHRMRRGNGSAHQQLLFPSIGSISIPTCNDLDLLTIYELVRLHLENAVFHDECPYVVT
jgi:hypothetical protein